MKKRRILSAFFVLCMVFSLMCLPVNAQGTEGFVYYTPAVTSVVAGSATVEFIVPEKIVSFYTTAGQFAVPHAFAAYYADAACRHLLNISSIQSFNQLSFTPGAGYEYSAASPAGSSGYYKVFLLDGDYSPLRVLGSDVLLQAVTNTVEEGAIADNHINELVDELFTLTGMETILSKLGFASPESIHMAAPVLQQGTGAQNHNLTAEIPAQTLLYIAAGSISDTMSGANSLALGQSFTQGIIGTFISAIFDNCTAIFSGVAEDVIVSYGQDSFSLRQLREEYKDEAPGENFNGFLSVMLALTGDMLVNIVEDQAGAVLHLNYVPKAMYEPFYGQGGYSTEYTLTLSSSFAQLDDNVVEKLRTYVYDALNGLRMSYSERVLTVDWELSERLYNKLQDKVNTKFKQTIKELLDALNDKPYAERISLVKTEIISNAGGYSPEEVEAYARALVDWLLPTYIGNGAYDLVDELFNDVSAEDCAAMSDLIDSMIEELGGNPANPEEPKRDDAKLMAGSAIGKIVNSLERIFGIDSGLNEENSDSYISTLLSVTNLSPGILVNGLYELKTMCDDFGIDPQSVLTQFLSTLNMYNPAERLNAFAEKLPTGKMLNIKVGEDIYLFDGGISGGTLKAILSRGTLSEILYGGASGQGLLELLSSRILTLKAGDFASGLTIEFIVDGTTSLTLDLTVAVQYIK